MTSLISGHGSEGGVVLQLRPVAVVGDHAGLIRRKFPVDQLPDGRAQRLQHFAFLRDIDLLERLQVGRMYGEELDELVHAFV